jgi:hypothetical protein
LVGLEEERYEALRKWGCLGGKEAQRRMLV